MSCRFIKNILKLFTPSKNGKGNSKVCSPYLNETKRGSISSQTVKTDDSNLRCLKSRKNDDWQNVAIVRKAVNFSVKDNIYSKSWRIHTCRNICSRSCKVRQCFFIFNLAFFEISANNKYKVYSNSIWFNNNKPMAQSSASSPPLARPIMSLRPPITT